MKRALVTSLLKKSATIPTPTLCELHDSDNCHRPSKRRRRSDTPPLTQGTLDAHNRATQPTSPLDRAESIKRWTECCGSSDGLEMPPRPTPSEPSSRGSSRGNRRRTAKLVRRQRSPSPTKGIGSPQYRAMNMADANVFVDHFHEAPTAEIEEQIARVFSRAWTEEQNMAIEDLARRYCEESRVLAKKCAGENEWRSHLLLGLLQPLSRSQPEVLMLSASEKPWLPDLKPTAPSPYDFIPAPVTPILRPPSAAQPSEHADPSQASPQTQSTTSILHNAPILSPSDTTSDISSESPTSLSTPKPDITLGLAHTSFTRPHRSVLMLLQDHSVLLSEPHQAQIGLRFPFLIVESKAGAAGGNMISAQNQAAVDGACALTILHDLQSVVARTTSRPDCAQYAHGAELGELTVPPPVLFSVTTEGPLHELWMHYRFDGAFHMACHGAWRTTRPQGASEFVRAVASVVEWGKEGFREDIVGSVARVEGPVFGRGLGVLRD